MNDKLNAYDLYCNRLESLGVVVERIKCDELLKRAGDVECILTVNEDEFRAIDTWLIYMKENDFAKSKIMTYGNFFYYSIVKENLCAIKKQGVSLINLIFEGNGYHRTLRKNIVNKFSMKGYKKENKLYSNMTEAFFDDLYTKEYADNILSIKYSVANQNGCSVLRDSKSRFYNVTDGIRATVGVPERYQRTVYFVGPCFIYGHYVEDANTMESILQRCLNYTGYQVKVVNCGSPAYGGHMLMQLTRIKTLPLKKGDILIFHYYNFFFDNMINLNLSDILIEHELNPGWVVDDLTHCNHKVNALYSDAVFNELQLILAEAVDGQGELIERDKDFIKTLYIDQYFSDFHSCIYENIGSIVMNCNPFTYGHRYLIEQALKIVDCLIIFVVEEDKSAFSFDERFAMVCKGVADFENVRVVPSGPFILSQTTFPEYFIKARDEELVENVEADITLFAERIALHLNIRYRFVGEELEDDVTNEYNHAMKRILPQYGIELIEIPRKKLDGKYISASKARKCLENSDMPGFKRLVPESTVEVLFGG